MNNLQQTIKQTGLKRILAAGCGVAVLLAIFYYSGLYTEFRGKMQSALLWSGQYDAKITTVEGPILSDHDYNSSLSTPNGQQVELGEFKDNVLFVNIWASWCLPCIAEMPTIETLHDDVSDNKNIKFLLVSVDKKREKAIQFMQSEDLPMPYYFPASGLPEPMKGTSIPTTYVISKEGQIVYQKRGMADYSSTSFKEWMLKLAES